MAGAAGARSSYQALRGLNLTRVALRRQELALPGFHHLLGGVGGLAASILRPFPIWEARDGRLGAALAL